MDDKAVRPSAFCPITETVRIVRLSHYYSLHSLFLDITSIWSPVRRVEWSDFDGCNYLAVYPIVMMSCALRHGGVVILYFSWRGPIQLSQRRFGLHPSNLPEPARAAEDCSNSPIVSIWHARQAESGPGVAMTLAKKKKPDIVHDIILACHHNLTITKYVQTIWRETCCQKSNVNASNLRQTSNLYVAHGRVARVAPL